MAPNDRSGVRVGGRKATAADHVDQDLMGGVGIVMGPQSDHVAPHKDRPPDIILPPTTPPGAASTQGQLRHTRRLTPEDRRTRRVGHTATALARKRSGSDDGDSPPGLTPLERRTKMPRGSPPPPPNGIKRLSEHLNGVVTDTTAVLLDRLNGVSKDLHRNGMSTHLAPGKNGIKCLNGVTAARVNGVTRINGALPPGHQRPERLNGAVRRLSTGELAGLKSQQDLGYHTNNNQVHHPGPAEHVLHPKPLLPVTPVAASLPHQPTTPLEAPTPLITAIPPIPSTPLSPTTRRAQQQESLTSVSAVTIATTPPPPPLIGREVSGAKPVLLQQQPRQQPPHKLSNALNGWLSRHSSSCSSTGGGAISSSSGISSGYTSSAPTSTPPSRPPTPDRSVRFPAPKKKETVDICRWSDCSATLDPTASLLEHIQAVHVEGQLSAENFRCLWVGCKVYDKASCSVSWLERHVLTHGGHKPFKCIVDGCGQRFASQTALGRHVNHHFNNSSATPSPRPQPTPSPTKLIRKNGRKCRYRKKPWSARMFDFFDASVMERIRWGLICVAEAQSSVLPNLDGTFVLNAQVHARRTNLTGEAEVLVKWLPSGVLSDEWVPVDKFEAKRSISLEKLSPEAKQIVSCKLYPVDPTTTRKHKRKRTTTSRDSLPLEDYKPLNI